MESNSLPVYEVEFLPLERRLGERRKNLFDARVFDLNAGPATERRQHDRRQPHQKGPRCLSQP
jgi:hypothetical protein